MKSSRHSFFTYLLLSILILCITSAFSHPLDISYTTLTPVRNGLYGETYIHPYELSLLAKQKGINFHKSNFKQILEIIIPYFIKNFKVYAGTQQLQLNNVKADSTSYAEILSDGLYVTFTIPKPGVRPVYNFEIKLFTTFFSTQTNKLLLLDKNGQTKKEYIEVYFTKKRTRWTLDLLNPDFSDDVDDNTDTDKDGLTDHLEKLYGTSPESRDTDKDGYTDFEEFYMGWDPLNYRASKGQNRSALAQIEAINNKYRAAKSMRPGASASTSYGQDGVITPNNTYSDSGELALATDEADVIPKKVSRPRSKSGNGYLREALLKIEDRLTGKWSWGGLLTVFIVVFVLGFIHAVSAGHGKGILISYMLDSNHQFSHALHFISVFTLTHLIDVVFLGIGGLIIASSVDPAALTPILQWVGGIGLLIIASLQIFFGIVKLRKVNSTGNNSQNLAARFFQFIKELGLFRERARNKTNNNSQNTNSSTKKRSAWIVGFLTGLAPCPFGWAIFMLLLNIGKMEFVFILIPIFGLGIFVSLLLFAIFVLVFRFSALRFFKGIEKYTVLVSGIILFIFSILFLMPGYSF